MADFCFQCNVDHYFGPQSDFDHLQFTGGKSFVYQVLCEGCGVILVSADGWCIDGECRLHDGEHMPAGRGEVYESARRWVARRSGPLGPLLRLRDRFLGTPWEPGHVHFPGHWPWYIHKLYCAIRDGEQMPRVGDNEDFHF